MKHKNCGGVNHKPFTLLMILGGIGGLGLYYITKNFSFNVIAGFFASVGLGWVLCWGRHHELCVNKEVVMKKKSKLGQTEPKWFYHGLPKIFYGLGVATIVQQGFHTDDMIYTLLTICVAIFMFFYGSWFEQLVKEAEEHDARR